MGVREKERERFVHHGSHKALFNLSKLKGRLMPGLSYGLPCSQQAKLCQLPLGFSQEWDRLMQQGFPEIAR